MHSWAFILGPNSNLWSAISFSSPLFKQRRKEHITVLLKMYKLFLLLLSLLCISVDSAAENSAAAAESHKGTFPCARVVAAASSERDLSRFTFWVVLPHWYLNFFKWLSMHFWVLIFRQTFGSPSSPRLLQDQPYINIVSYSYSDQQRPIPFSHFSPSLFFKKRANCFISTTICEPVF